MDKSGEKKSKLRKPFREPGEGESGYGGRAEHGLGAGVSTGRVARGRPLQRNEA